MCQARRMGPSVYRKILHRLVTSHVGKGNAENGPRTALQARLLVSADSLPPWPCSARGSGHLPPTRTPGTSSVFRQARVTLRGYKGTVSRAVFCTLPLTGWQTACGDHGETSFSPLSRKEPLRAQWEVLAAPQPQAAPSSSHQRWPHSGGGCQIPPADSFDGRARAKERVTSEILLARAYASGGPGSAEASGRQGWRAHTLGPSKGTWGPHVHPNPPEDGPTSTQTDPRPPKPSGWRPHVHPGSPKST